MLLLPFDWRLNVFREQLLGLRFNFVSGEDWLRAAPLGADKCCRFVQRWILDFGVRQGTFVLVPPFSTSVSGGHSKGRQEKRLRRWIIFVPYNRQVERRMCELVVGQKCSCGRECTRDFQCADVTHRLRRHFCVGRIASVVIKKISGTHDQDVFITLWMWFVG